MNKRNSTDEQESHTIGSSEVGPDPLAEFIGLEVDLSSMIRSAMTHLDEAARSLIVLKKRPQNSDAIAEDALMELSVIQAWFRALLPAELSDISGHKQRVKRKESVSGFGFRWSWLGGQVHYSALAWAKDDVYPVNGVLGEPPDVCDCADSAQYVRFQAMATKQADVEWKELVAFMKSVKDAGMI